MGRKLIFLVNFSILSFLLPAQTATLHMICVIDRYSNIAQSCQKDFENVKQFFTDVANDLKIPVKVYDVEFSVAKSKEFISDFNCGTDDIVFFYYSGHGFRYDDQDIVWPYLSMCRDQSESIQQCSLSLNWIYQEIEKKNPRLTISIGDCCNNLIGINEPKMNLTRSMSFRAQHTPEGYKKLFLDSKGSIVVSGSIPGQYSLGTEDGGIFTNSLIDVLRNSRENSSVNWKLVLAKATEISQENSKYEQKPHFMVINDQGRYYSEGNYPDNQVTADVINSNDENVNDEVTDNPEENPDDVSIADDEDYQEYDEEYDNSEIQSEALFSMGLIYLVGLTSDDGNVSDKELKSFDEFFHTTMTSWGYEPENIDEFISELGDWIGNLGENDVEQELQNSLQTLKKYYDQDDFEQIVFEYLRQMVDNPQSTDFQDMLEIFRNLSN